MKVKEQLARNYWMQDPEGRMKGSEPHEIEAAFMAGMEQMRHMAIQTMSDTPHALFRLMDLGEEDQSQPDGSGG